MYKIHLKEDFVLSKLFTPIEIGLLKLNSRLVMPPMATSKCPDGLVNEDILNYYGERSLGGHIGLIIIEHSYITAAGKANNNQLSIASDSTIDKLKELSSLIHKNGSKAVMQINHAGIQTSEIVTGEPLVAASNAPHPRNGSTGTELTPDKIKEMVKLFGEAAGRVKAAGFDGVEIHSAHGYLLHQFFSPLTNKRTDSYGGDVMSRIKIHLEVIKEVRTVVGPDFPVLLRLGASDFKDGGATIEDSLIASKEFEKAGINILDISGGFNGYTHVNANEEGYFHQLTSAIKKVVSIPVILTGGVVTPEGAEKLLEENKADLIGVGRAIYKNANWAKDCFETLK